MKLLLDTHIFIWWADEPEKLSPAVTSALENETNELILSLVSIWEIQIKVQLGKLKLKQPLKELIVSQQEANDLQLLPIELAHVLALDTLPFHHRDPFDRLLVAQSMIQNMALVTADDMLTAYPIKLVR